MELDTLRFRGSCQMLGRSWVAIQSDTCLFHSSVCCMLKLLIFRSVDIPVQFYAMVKHLS